MRENKKVKLLEYFCVPPPLFNVYLIILSILLIVFGCYEFYVKDVKYGTIAILLAILVIGIGIYFYTTALKWFKERPTDSEIDRWLMEDIKDFDKIALKKLNLTNDDLIAPSLFIYAPVYTQRPNLDIMEIRRREGEDNYYRYSVWRIQVYLLTKDYIAKYEFIYVWIRDTFINEYTGEFYYKDIVSVRTESESTAHNLINGANMQYAQTFTLSLSGDKESVIYNSPELRPTPFVSNNVDNTVQVIRDILRQKKTT